MIHPINRKRFLISLVLILLLSACDLKTPPPQITEPIPTSFPQLLSTSTLAPAEVAPPPEERLPDADLALSFGDFQQALTLYRQNRNNPNPALASAALFGEALTLYKLNRPDEARPLFQECRDTYPQTPTGKRAPFWLGVIAEASPTQITQAIADYQMYLNNMPETLDSFVYERIGGLYATLDQPQLSLDAYRNAFVHAGSDDQIRLAIKLGAAYADNDQADKALEIYQEAYAKSDNDYTKASLGLAIGNLEISNGNPEKGFEYFQDVVNNFPKTYDAYSALAALIDAEQEVDELQRGLINYYIGQPKLAIEAFDRYLAGEALKGDEALYYKALAVRDEGLAKAAFDSAERAAWNLHGGSPEDKQAIGIWTQMLKDYPTTPFRVDTIEDIVYTQFAYMSAPQAAIDTSLVYVAQTPEAEYSARILWATGRYQEQIEQFEEAAETWSSIGMRFPASAEAFNGLFFGGMMYYRIGNLAKAAEALNRAILLTEQPLELAGAYLWLGKVAAQNGDQASASQNWEAAISADPGGYYGLRARELIEHREPFALSNSPRFDVDLARERQIAADWMRTAFVMPANLNLDYTQALFEQPRFKAAVELTRLGLFDEASAQFDLIRAEHDTDAANQFRLIKVFLENGFYKGAILASKSITKLAGFGDYPFSAILPPYFAYVTYGAYYQPWVSAIADKYNLPELVLYSLIHQESHFDGIAHSSAGAGGLMQVMPDTAAQIAAETGFPANFTRADLYNGYINLELGANYLARQLAFFNNDLYLALAAYNAGPGSVIDWQKQSNGDSDQFLGVVRYQETRSYIRRLAENYDRYVKIYAQ